MGFNVQLVDNGRKGKYIIYQRLDLDLAMSVLDREYIFL